MRSQETANSFRVAEAFNRTRLDAFLSAAMPDASRAKVQAAIREGLVLVNGAAPTKPGHSVRAGDVVTAQLLPPPPVEALPEVRCVVCRIHPPSLATHALMGDTADVPVSRGVVHAGHPAGGRV